MAQVAGGYTFAPSISAEELENGRGISLTYSSSRVHKLHVSTRPDSVIDVTWSEIQLAGVPWPPRGGHAALKLASHTILLCGGGAVLRRRSLCRVVSVSRPLSVSMMTPTYVLRRVAR